jgi:hypothetical protein
MSVVEVALRITSPDSVVLLFLLLFSKPRPTLLFRWPSGRTEMRCPASTVLKEMRAKVKEERQAGCNEHNPRDQAMSGCLTEPAALSGAQRD